MINGKPEAIRDNAVVACSRSSGHSKEAETMSSPESDAESGALLRIHHAAIICGDYAVSKQFYTGALGLRVIAEHYRAERRSWKLDLALPDGSQVELFSFQDRPPRPSYPEARGLRHLAFEVADVGAWKARLQAQGIAVEAIRVDEYTGRRFTFFADPDDLPLELYEAAAGRQA